MLLVSASICWSVARASCARFSSLLWEPWVSGVYVWVSPWLEPRGNMIAFNAVSQGGCCRDVIRATRSVLWKVPSGTCHNITHQFYWLQSGATLDSIDPVFPRILFLFIAPVPRQHKSLLGLNLSHFFGVTCQGLVWFFLSLCGSRTATTLKNLGHTHTHASKFICTCFVK